MSRAAEVAARDVEPASADLVTWIDALALAAAHRVGTAGSTDSPAPARRPSPAASSPPQLVSARSGVGKNILGIVPGNISPDFFRRRRLGFRSPDLILSGSWRGKKSMSLSTSALKPFTRAPSPTMPLDLHPRDRDLHPEVWS